MRSVRSRLGLRLASEAAVGQEVRPLADHLGRFGDEGVPGGTIKRRRAAAAANRRAPTPPSALRGVARGRKAWLFCGSDRGGESTR